jgi:hypothetical protein
LVTSPLASGTYGKVVTIYDDDVNQANFNPATINAEMDNHLALNYGSYFEIWNSFYAYIPMIAIYKRFKQV